MYRISRGDAKTREEEKGGRGRKRVRLRDGKVSSWGKRRMSSERR